MIHITTKGEFISCLGENTQKLAKHASFFGIPRCTVPSAFQQSPACNRNFHGNPLLHSLPRHCTPRSLRDSDALIAGKCPSLALSEFRSGYPRGRGGHVVSLADARH